MNDLIENPSTRCACMLVLDTSGSMSGEPINELNQGLKDFLQAIKEDEVAMYSVDLGIVSTGSGAPRTELNFTGCSGIEVIQPLSANGGTPLGGAVHLALSALEQRKTEYKNKLQEKYGNWVTQNGVRLFCGPPSLRQPYQGLRVLGLGF